MFGHVQSDDERMAPMLNFLELWTERNGEGFLVPVRATFKGAASLRAANRDQLLLSATQLVTGRFPHVAMLYVNFPDGELVEVGLPPNS